MADNISSNYLMVVAIDFGTTYSGYAFSMRKEFISDPLKIHSNATWNVGKNMLGSIKTSTCLLLDNNEEFIAFGYEAEKTYADLFLDDKHGSYYYFHRFKMYLHNNKNITHDMLLDDITETKQLPAIEVFKHSIRYLVKHLLGQLENQGTGVRLEEVRWVLTVPAIWTDTAKTFMRTSAEEAGIQSENLLLALEPETASIYCQYLPVEKLQGSEQGFTMTRSGTKYMVVDIGGGTADITVHQKVCENQLQELCRAIGNDCGGTSIDKRFLNMLEQICGHNVLLECKRNVVIHMDLIHEFEAVKRSFKPEKEGKISMTIPIDSLNNVCKELENKDMKRLIELSEFSSDVEVKYNKLRFNVDTMRALFKDTIRAIVELMKVTLNKDETGGVSTILMVGGFSECSLLQQAIRAEFPEKRVIIPEEAGMSVLKGAVLFGHKPNYIKSRVMRVSYGVKVNHPFDSRKHDEKHKVVMEGEEKCDNIFSVIVQKDEHVEGGTKIKKSFYTPYRNQEVMDFMIFTSDNPHPSYIDDEGCEFLCKPTITFPDVCEEKRWVDVEFVFGDTEIGLKAVDRNSRKDITSKINLI